MRGRELGLTGQDLMIYQMGEVVQIGVQVEKALSSWIERSYDDLGVPRDQRKAPKALAAQVALAVDLVGHLPGYTDEERQWIHGALDDTKDAMQSRNRVIHDQWLSFGDGNLTRFGYFAARGGHEAVEIEPGIGPGQYSHEDWEGLRTLLWHCYWRLSSLTWVRRHPPEYEYFFHETERHYEMIRGEFYLGRDYLVPWSWSRFTQAEVDAMHAEAAAAEGGPPASPQNKT